MKRAPKIGSIGEIPFRVEKQHCIDFASNGMPEVLCTPWLIWFLEHAAREAVLPFLDETESTVGTEIEVRHEAATPVGESVICRARLVQVDGRSISFQLEAHDEHERIAKGFHKLRIIKVGRFAKRVESKSKTP